ncbi:hypothetical protein MP228_005964 [Amoeboaphelidium protococcarum]|nr:hypothetical protein MP228_005964 [Amoeboaphelidium protococcarum]
MDTGRESINGQDIVPDQTMMMAESPVEDDISLQPTIVSNVEDPRGEVVLNKDNYEVGVEQRMMPNQQLDSSDDMEVETIDDDSVIVKDDDDQSDGRQENTLWSQMLSAGPGTLSSNGQSALGTWNVNELFRMGFADQNTQLVQQQKSDVQIEDISRTSLGSFNEGSNSDMGSADDLQLLDGETRRLLEQHINNQTAGRGSIEQVASQMYNIRMKELLKRLLDLPNPRITDQMMDLLQTQGVVECLMSFITRIDYTNSADSSVNCSTVWDKDLFYSTERLSRVCYSSKKQSNDMWVQKYSYNTVDLFYFPNTQNVKLLDIRFREIIASLFNVFDEQSDGNYHHFCKFIDYVILRDGNRLLDFVMNKFLSPRNSAVEIPLIMRMLVGLGHSAVEQILIRLLFKSFGNVNEDPQCLQRQVERFRVLSNFRFVESLWNIVLLDPGNDTALQSMIRYAADFISDLIESGREVEGAIMLFYDYCQDPSSVLDLTLSRIEQLLSTCISWRSGQQLEGSVSDDSSIMLANCLIKVLYQFSVKSSLKLVKPLGANTSNAGTPVNDDPSCLADLSLSTNRHLVTKLSQVVNVIDLYLEYLHLGKTSIKVASHTVKGRVPSHLVNLMHVLFEVLKSAVSNSEESRQSVLQISLKFWAKLQYLFIRLTHHSIFQFIFTQIMVLLIRTFSNDPWINELMIKSDFIKKSISLVKQNKGNKGFVIYCWNIIRLQVESNPQCQLALSLNGTDEMGVLWKECSPELRSTTLSWIRQQMPIQEIASLPFPQVAPVVINIKQLQPDIVSEISGNGDVHDGFSTLRLDSILRQQRSSIDLGSIYAAHLGFAKSPVKSAEKEQQKYISNDLSSKYNDPSSDKSQYDQNSTDTE